MLVHQAYLFVCCKASWLPDIAVVEDLGKAIGIQLKHSLAILANLHLVLQWEQECRLVSDA